MKEWERENAFLPLQSLRSNPSPEIRCLAMRFAKLCLSFQLEIPMSNKLRHWIKKLSRPVSQQVTRKRSSYRPYLEQLEDRRLFATNITQYHVDSQSTGANLTETQLTSSNVNAADFGQLYNTPWTARSMPSLWS